MQVLISLIQIQSQTTLSDLCFNCMLKFIEDLIASRMDNCFPERLFIHKEVLIIMLGFECARGMSSPVDGGGEFLFKIKGFLQS